MFFYKLKKYYEGVGFVQRDIQNTISASYNKAENEYGQFEFDTYNKENPEYQIEIDDFVELWAGENKICSGYVASLSFKEQEVKVICFTEEYKLEKILLPTNYTLNFSGLNLKNLCNNLRNRYMQVRWSDKYDFSDTNKIKYCSPEVKIENNFYLSSGVYSETSSTDFIYEVSEYFVESGVIEGQYYDRVAIIDIFQDYYNKASYASFITPRSKTYLDNFMDSEITVRGMFPYNGRWKIRKFSDGEVITSNTHTNLGSVVPGNPLRYYEVIGGRGTKIKLYISSLQESFDKFELGFFKSYDLRLLYEDPSGFAGGIIVQHRGSKKENGFNRISGWLNLTSGNYEGYKLDRIRIAEPYVDVGQRIADNYPETYTENYSTNTLIVNFENTAGIYDPSKIPTTFPADLMYYVNYPNENSELAGFYFGGTNEENQDLYFSIYSNIYNTRSLDEALNNKIDDLFINSVCLKAIEFVLYKIYIDDYEIDTSIENLTTTDFEIDKNSNYEVLKTVCDNLNVIFYVENDKLYVKDKSTFTSNTYNLKENVNCKISSYSVTNENSYNMYLLEGEGDSPINRPLVLSYLSPIKDEINHSKYIKTGYTNVTDLQSAKTGDKFFDWTNFETDYENKTVLFSVEIINHNIIKVGDKVNISTENKKTYKNLEVKEVEIIQSGELIIQKINLGNPNKKIT